jgi:RNA recognition motif-containing protein
LRFGDLDDVIVMKDRATGRSRGFGYVTFSSAENAQVCHFFKWWLYSS